MAIDWKKAANKGLKAKKKQKSYSDLAKKEQTKSVQRPKANAEKPKTDWNKAVSRGQNAQSGGKNKGKSKTTTSSQTSWQNYLKSYTHKDKSIQDTVRSAGRSLANSKKTMMSNSRNSTVASSWGGKTDWNKAAKLGTSQGGNTRVNNKVVSNTLTNEEMNKLSVAAMSNNLENLLKGDKKLAKKVAQIDFEQLTAGGASTASQAALGAMTMGNSSVDRNIANGMYTKKQREAIQKAKESNAYMAGTMIGEGVNFATAGVGGSSIASGLLKGSTKALAKGTVKASGKNIAKKIGAETLGDAIASAPMNVVSSYKQSLDANGKFNKKAFLKNMAVNEALDIGIGGTVSGAMAGWSAKNVKKFADIVEKVDKKGVYSLSNEELKTFEQLTGKYIGEDTDIITKGAVDKAKGYKADGTLGDASDLRTFRGDIDNIKQGKETVKPRQDVVSADYQRATKKFDSPTQNEYVADIYNRKMNGEDITVGEQQMLDRALAREEFTPPGGSTSRMVGENTTPRTDVELFRKNIGDIMKTGNADAKEMRQNVNDILKGKDTEKPKVEANAEAKTDAPVKTPDETVSRLKELRREIEGNDQSKQLGKKLKEEGFSNVYRDVDIPSAMTHVDLHNRIDDMRANGMNNAQIDKALSKFGVPTKKRKQLIEGKFDVRTEVEKNNGTARRNVNKSIDKMIKNNPDATDEKLAEMVMKNHLHNGKRMTKQQARDYVNGMYDTRTQAEIASARRPATVDDVLEQLDKTEGKAQVLLDVKGTDKPTLKGRILDAALTIRRAVTDDLAPLEQYARDMKYGKGIFEGKPKPKEAEVFYAYINANRTAKNKATSWITLKRRDFAGNKCKRGDESLADIFKPYLKDDEKYEQFQNYMFHKHNIDRIAQGKPVFGENVTADQSKAFVKLMEKEHPEFKADAQKVYDWNADLKDVMVDSGLMSKELSSNLDSIYKNYVPTLRVIEGKGKASNGKSLTFGRIKEAKGGDQDLLPLHESLSRKALSVIRDSETNQLLGKMAELNGFKLSDFAEDFKGVSPDDMLSATVTTAGDGKTIHFFVDGKPTKMEVDEQLYKAFENLKPSEKKDYMLVRLARNCTSLFKKLIIDWNPVFVVKNGLRDGVEGLIYSKYGASSYVKNYIKVMKMLTFDKLVGNDNSIKAIRELYLENGGKWSNLVDMRKDLNYNALHKYTFGALDEINSAMESVPRLAEFISTLEHRGVDINNFTRDTKLKGDDIRVAMHNAQDVTLNFTRGGTVTRALNGTLVPFLNPSVQGFDKLLRQFTNIKGANKRQTVGNIGSLIYKMGIIGVAPAVLNEVWLHGNQAYQELNDRDKDSYYFFPNIFRSGNVNNDNADDEPPFIRIPKSRLAVTLSTPFTEMYRNWQYSDGYDATYVFKEAWEASGIVDVKSSLITAPFKNAVITKETWYGANFESYGDERIRAKTDETKGQDSGDIWDENTSWFAKKLGNTAVAKKLPNAIAKATGKDDGTDKGLSPKQIDALLDGYGGIVADLAIEFSKNKNMSAEDFESGKNTMAFVARGLWNSLVTSQFTKDATYSNKLSTDFFNKYDELKKSADKSSGNSKSKEALDHFNNTYRHEFFKMSDCINGIENDTSLSRKEKNRKIDELKKAQNQLLREGINGERPTIDTVSTVAEITGSYNNALMKYGDKYQLEAFDKWKEKAGFTKLKGKELERRSKQFVEATKEIKALSNESHAKYDYDYGAIAMVSLDKKMPKLMEAFGVNEYTVDAVKKFKKYGGDAKNYSSIMKKLSKQTASMGIDKEDYTYLADWQIAGAMACDSKIKMKDRAYALLDDTVGYKAKSNDVMSKMNSARGCASFGWSAKRLNEVGETIPKNDKGYMEADEIEKAIDKLERKDGKKMSKQEKACLFEFYGYKKYTNPYGTVKDYSLKADVGATTSSGSGYGGHRRGGHRRGSGGSSSGKGSTDWNTYLKDMGIGAEAKSSSSKNVSGLTDAYRTKLNKVRKNRVKYKS